MSSEITEERLKRAASLGAGLTKKEKYVLRHLFKLPLSERAAKIVGEMSEVSYKHLMDSAYDKIQKAETKSRTEG